VFEEDVRVRGALAGGSDAVPSLGWRQRRCDAGGQQEPDERRTGALAPGHAAMDDRHGRAVPMARERAIFRRSPGRRARRIDLRRSEGEPGKDGDG